LLGKTISQGYRFSAPRGCSTSSFYPLDGKLDGYILKRFIS
jgi:hypothetical protein